MRIYFRRLAERFVFWYMEHYSDALFTIQTRTHFIKMQKKLPGPDQPPRPRKDRPVA